ncbi:tungstate transport system ATP-binding protein [Methanolinea mesophila]|uniref:ABC transporter ATP-binding protein n=1 Tax=Methanolinea mesophila TaxID=547055 RepID=UPI001AEBA19A|nr:ABC transporter ATP-binding protein [Methanolinea mesophila]MBP1929546.1 tungstate transport system ATP-binding protein [Methanolinea mesophila]
MIELSHMSKYFGEKKVVEDISLEIRKGEVFSFIGPSGTGKTTLLRLINLLDTPTSGKILFEGEEPVGDRARTALRRRMSMVFQKPLPLRGDVFSNVAIGLVFRHVSREEISARVPEALELVGLGGYEERKAVTLSGGELQRVAIARAIVTRPEILLLDEPTANLDPISTERAESLIFEIHRRFGVTIILSTHDMVQGQRLADRMAVIIDRTLGQVGTPYEIFYKPASLHVARMVGVDNVLEGEVTTVSDGLATIDVAGLPIQAVSDLPPLTKVRLYLRPEEIWITSGTDRGSARNLVQGTVKEITPMGSMVRLKVDCGPVLTSLITRRSFEDLTIAKGQEVYISFKASAIYVAREEKNR